MHGVAGAHPHGTETAAGQLFPSSLCKKQRASLLGHQLGPPTLGKVTSQEAGTATEAVAVAAMEAVVAVAGAVADADATGGIADGSATITLGCFASGDGHAASGSPIAAKYL